MAEEQRRRDASAADALAALGRIEKNLAEVRTRVAQTEAAVVRGNVPRYGAGGGGPVVERGEQQFQSRARFIGTQSSSGLKEQRTLIDQGNAALVKRTSINEEHLAQALRYLEYLRAQGAAMGDFVRRATQARALLTTPNIAGQLPVRAGGGGGIVPPYGGGAGTFVTPPPRPIAGLLPAPGQTVGGSNQTYLGQGRIVPNPGQVKAYYTELQRAAVIQQSASQQMRRHGALTTEFLTALVRGETTLAEFRYQLGATIGKFAGWTAAATAVYTVVDAVRQLGTGAVEGLSAVQDLARFVPAANFDRNRAASQIGDLSQKYNVTPDVVGQASIGAAKVYKDQNDALNATGVILKSVQVGELEAADATKYFAAIARGAHLDVNDLNTVLDQFNNAQNQIGTSTADAAQGTARATASWTQAGGSLNTLIALMTTLQALTGESGQTIGTALVRSVANVRRPSNQAVLKEFGIDPSQGLDAIYQQALQKAPTLNAAERTRLGGQGLSTPQYGRFFSALLANPQAYERARKVTSPEQAGGSADRELAVRLGAVREQIKRVGVELQVMGLRLAQSGVFDLLGAGIHTLVLTLQAVNAVLKEINRIPEPLRHAVIYFAELAAVLALIRRTGVSQALAERAGIPALGRAPEELQRRQAVRTSRAVEGVFVNEREQLANQATAARTRALISRAQAEELAVQAGQTRSLSESAKLEREAVKLRAQATNATEEATRLAARERLVADQALHQQGITRDLQKRRVTATEAGIGYIPGGPLGGTEDARRTGRNLPDARLRPLSSRAAVLQAGIDSQIAAASAANAARLERTGRQATAGAARLERGALAASSAVARTADTIGRGAGGVSRGAGRLLAGAGTLASALGPLDLALIGIGAAVIGGAAIIRNAHETAARIEQFSAAGQNFDDEMKRLQAAQKASKPKGTPWYAYPSAFAGNVLDTIGGVQPDEDPEVAAAAAAVAKKNARLSAVNTARAQGKAANGAYLSEIGKQFKLDIQDAKDADDLKGALGRRLTELRHSVEAHRATEKDRQELSRVEQRLRDLYASSKQVLTGDPFSAFQNASPDAYGNNIELIQGRLNARGGRRPARALRQLGAGFLTAAERFGNSSDPKELKLVTDSADAFYDSATKDIQDDLQQNLKLATNRSGRASAYGSALGRLRAEQRTLRNTRDSQVKERDQTRNQLRKAEDELQPDDHGPIGGAGSDQAQLRGARSQKLQQRVERLRRDLKVQNGRVKRSSDALSDMRKRLDAFEIELQRQDFQDFTESVNRRLAFRQSQTFDSGASLKLAIQAQGQIVRRAIAAFGRGSDEAIEAITRENELNKQLVQDRLTSIRSKGNLRTAGIRGSGTGADAQRTASDIQTAQQVVAELRRSGGDQDDINDAQAEVLRLQNQQADQVKENARKIAEAQFNYRLAGIVEPVARARATLRFNRSQLAGLTGVERIDQQTKIRESENDLRRSIVDEDLAQARFQHDTGKLSDDAYIRELRGILKTKKLGKDMRRQLLTEIYNLEHGDSSNYELEVGNIRLPTLYEIRRQVQGNRSGTNSISVTQQTRFGDIHVASPADAEHLGRVLEDQGAAGISSALRAGAVR